jgi:hypothetical protein
MPDTVSIVLTQDDALMLADCCLQNREHYRRLLVDFHERGDVGSMQSSWVEQAKYWREMYQRLFNAATELPTELPDLARPKTEFATMRFPKAGGDS